MNAKPLSIPEVILLTPRVFGDDRGFFTKASMLKLSQRQLALPQFLCRTIIRVLSGVC